MANNRHKLEEIVTKQRQVEVLVGQGMARIDTIREIRITEQIFCRYRKQYGGMGTDVVDVLTDLFTMRGVPAFIRSDNDLSPSPRRSGHGSTQSDITPPISYQARHGRTDIVKVSTPVSGTNYSSVKSSTP